MLLRVQTKENKITLKREVNRIRVKAARGAQGPGATVLAGNTNQVPPTEPANVVNVGTPTDAILDFYIPQGERGEQGSDGQGVPAGGLLGQILAKTSGNDFDTEWVDQPKGEVISVNGKDGVVVLDASDVGADQAGSAATAESNSKQYTDDEINSLNIDNRLDGKVDKEVGKGLSEEDYTSAEKLKLSGIEAGAEVNKIDSIVQGANVVIDNTDPQNPIISATGGGGSAYTFTSGLTEEDGTVKLGGEVDLDTSLSVLDTNLLFDSYDMGPLGLPLSTGNMAMSRETDIDLGSGDMLLKHRIGLDADQNGLMMPGVSMEAGVGPTPSTENPELMPLMHSRIVSDLLGQSMMMESVYKTDSTQETTSSRSAVVTSGSSISLEHDTEGYGKHSIDLGQSGISFSYGSSAGGRWIQLGQSGISFNYGSSAGGRSIELGDSGISFRSGSHELDSLYKEGRFTNVADPVEAQDVATKKYVDDNAGGGGQSYQFQNGLTEEDGTVKLGGEVEDGTAITLGSSGLTFHEVDLEPLTGEVGVAHGASLETELDVPGLNVKSGVGTIADLGGIKFPLASIYATYKEEDDTETIVTTGPLTGAVGVGSQLQATDGSVFGIEQLTANMWSVTAIDSRGEDQKGFMIAAVHEGFQFAYGNSHTLFFKNGRIEGLGDGTEPDHAVNKSQLDLKANASDTVNLTGDQTVADVKTFSSSPVVPTPNTDYQAATKKYVDDNVGDIEAALSAVLGGS